MSIKIDTAIKVIPSVKLAFSLANTELNPIASWYDTFLELWFCLFFAILLFNLLYVTMRKGSNFCSNPQN